VQISTGDPQLWGQEVKGQRSRSHEAKDIFRGLILDLPPYLHLATSEMWFWYGGRGT